jgi:hypothetical protein
MVQVVGGFVVVVVVVVVGNLFFGQPRCVIWFFQIFPQGF